MRPLPRRIPTISASVLAAFLVITGCSEIQDVSQGIDKAQQCVQATGIVTETAAKVAGLVNDPAEMEKALNDGAAKLGTLADEAANTTLKEAAEGVSKDLEGLNATNANNAVDAAQKVATDSVKWVEQLAGACGG
ncbi:hypothetical protein AB0M44_00120 [Streptosporangium subroseum]|uniref:hypothetical protein n=1 Tax=Streptosporangium subroseum TaxID=106412 RepID=UPI0034173453